jgi:hypothetical protein
MSACLPRSRPDNSDGNPDADDASGPIPHSNGEFGIQKPTEPRDFQAIKHDARPSGKGLEPKKDEG